MTTFVLMVWLTGPGAGNAPARVDEYRTIEACEAAGLAWKSYIDTHRWHNAAQWACLPGEG